MTQALTPAPGAGWPVPVGPPTFNTVDSCVFRSGWVAWLAGENQCKAVSRTVATVNASGRKVTAMAQDRWSIWRRLLWALILVCTLGFVGRSPGVVIVSEPLH